MLAWQVPICDNHPPRTIPPRAVLWQLDGSSQVNSRYRCAPKRRQASLKWRPIVRERPLTVAQMSAKRRRDISKATIHGCSSRRKPRQANRLRLSRFIEMSRKNEVRDKSRRQLPESTEAARCRGPRAALRPWLVAQAARSRKWTVRSTPTARFAAFATGRSSSSASANRHPPSGCA
jgi:hypothetical protein